LGTCQVYLQWKKNGYRNDWCNKHFIHGKAMKKVKEVRVQILDICKQLKMRVETCGTDWDLVRKAVCSAYFMNAGKMKSVAECVAQPGTLLVRRGRRSWRRAHVPRG
jgi:pre-mRNA-splicing factor ATP-dependent RNA helicase DHX38/PRP16